VNDRPYVVLGSVWLMLAVILRLGQKTVSYAPGYAFFGVGGWLSPAAYWSLIIVCAVIGIVFVCHKKRP
jgi:hypothetical protein